MSEKIETGVTPEVPKEKYFVFIELETKSFEYEVHASSKEEADELASQAIEKQGLSISSIEVNEKAYSPDHLDDKLGDDVKEGQRTFYVFAELDTKGLEFEVSASSKEKAEEIAIAETYKRKLRVAYAEVNEKPYSPDHLAGKLEE